MPPRITKLLELAKKVTPPKAAGERFAELEPVIITLLKRGCSLLHVRNWLADHDAALGLQPVEWRNAATDPLYRHVRKVAEKVKPAPPPRRRRRPVPA